jgi:NAD(P)-dependent dehydrogenase (short-subunit alcohol dehydrogenase family)
MLPERLLETVASSTMPTLRGKPHTEVARMGARFEGRVVVVTGGARGIGDAIVRRMVAEGARAVVPDLADPADPVPGARYLRCDITDGTAVEEAHATIEATEGRLDVLVNNAGIQRVALTDEFDPEAWSLVVDVHLKGAFNWSRLALRTMKRQHAGVIVSVASVAGIIALPGRGPYSAAKAALMALTRTMAVEVADAGIRVNAVAPGMALTALVQQGIDDGSIDLEAMRTEIPMRRLATLGEITNAVCFLASDEASYITGQTLVVDGGWSILGMHRRPEWLAGEPSPSGTP